MKAKISFSLPEEENDFYYAVNGSKFAHAIYNFDNFLRSKLKYEELTEEQAKIYEEIREKLREEIGDLDFCK